MLFKRGSTISAAEGGCQAEVGGMTGNTSKRSELTRIADQLPVLWQALDLQLAWVVSNPFTTTSLRGPMSFVFQLLQRRCFRCVTELV